MSGSITDQWVQQWSGSIARWAVQTAVDAVMALLQALGTATEPSFGTIGPAYKAFIAFALIERVLGGPRGAGWEVLPRTLFCCMGAFVALGVVEYAATFANLLATAWNSDLFGSGALMQSKVQAAYSSPMNGSPALGSAGGMFLVALITTLLALLINIELILRAALILVTTTFLPLMCVMAIWPRQAGALRHLVEFLVALLMSKFVIATAVYVGFNLVAHGFAGGRPGQDAPNAMITGLATLLIAAFSPLLLLQGIKIAEAGAAQTARHWGGHAVRGASAVGGFGLGAALSRASFTHARSGVRQIRSRRSGGPKEGAKA